MNSKNRVLIFSIFFILIIIILTNISNNQKTTFRYFTWNIQNVSIGRLISISFLSGLLVSSIFNKLIILEPMNKISNKVDSENTFDEEIDDNKIEMPPERDLRDPQPTISVNYRVIKNMEDNSTTYEDNTKTDKKYEDDWNDKDSEW